jgi:hypothetical protein
MISQSPTVDTNQSALSMRRPEDESEDLSIVQLATSYGVHPEENALPDDNSKRHQGNLAWPLKSAPHLRKTHAYTTNSLLVRSTTMLAPLFVCTPHQVPQRAT